MKYSYTTTIHPKKQEPEVRPGAVWFTDVAAAKDAVELYWSMLKFAPSVTRMDVVNENGEVLHTWQ